MVTAATNVFTNASGDGNWNNPANWSAGYVPSYGSAGSPEIDNVTGRSTATVANNQSAILDGQVLNSGTIALASFGNGTDLIVGQGDTVTLKGGGTIALSDNTQNYILSNTANSTLDNVDNTIAGAGQIEASLGLSLINESAGTINANAANNALSIHDIAVTNAGTIEATGAGGLQVANVSLANTGVVEALSGAQVTFANSTIAGGFLTTDGKVSAGTGLTSTIHADASTVLDGTAAPVTITAGSTVAVDNNNSLFLGDGSSGSPKPGSIVNKGTIALNSVGNGTNLYVGTGGGSTVTLSGGGTVALSDNTQNYILSNYAGETLDNLDNTIAGAGQIESYQGLTFINEAGGTVDATSASNTLSIHDIAVTNKGTFKADGAAGLALTNVTLANTGTIQVASGSQVVLNNTIVKGGTLAVGGTGLIHADGSTVLDGTASPVTITTGSTVAVDNNNSLFLADKAAATTTLVNHGTIALNSIGNGTNLYVGTGGGGTVALSGGGTVALSDNTQNYIASNYAGETLDNIDNTIVGAGQIESYQGLTFINEAGGTVDATSASNTLSIHDIAVTNKGTFKADGAAGLALTNVTLANSGTIQVASGSQVVLNNTTVKGGTLAVGGTGLIHADGSTVLDGTASPVTITTGSTVAVDNNNSLFLADGGNGASQPGSIVNKGTIALNSIGNGTNLYVGTGGGSTVTLSGGGTVALSDNTQNYIASNYAGETLDNIDNTIVGAGQIESYQGLTFINEAKGVVDATSASNTLSIHDIAVTNKGTFKADGAAGLALTNVTLANSGTIQVASGSQVVLNNTTVKGGTLAVGGTGLIHADGSTVLDGTASPVTITTGSTVAVDNNNSLYLADGGSGAPQPGSIVNKGTIALNSIGNGTNLYVGTGGGSTVTLSGGGTVALSDNTQNYIASNYAGETLDNIDNTILGAGQIESYQGLTVINEAKGVIDATFGDNALRVYNITLTNKGLMEATGGGVLQIDGSATITNPGTIEAFDGSKVQIAHNSRIVGGTLANTATGTLETYGDAVLDGTGSTPLTIASGATLNLDNNNSLLLADITTAGAGSAASIVNKGTIALNSIGNGTILFVGTGGGSTVALSGGGTVALSDNTQNFIESNYVGETLDNIDNTIAGAGQLQSYQGLTFVNEAGGTVAASFGDNALVIHDISNTNKGTYKAQNGATLQVGGLTNVTADAAFAGGSVLTGGTYTVTDPLASASSQASVIALNQNAAPITTLAATINLTGATSAFTSAGTALGASLRVIAAGGALNLGYGTNSGSGQAFADTAGALEVAGSLALVGSTLSDASITIDSGGTLSGASAFPSTTVAATSTVNGALVNNGRVTSQGTISAGRLSTLVLNGNVTGTGTLAISGDSVLEVAALGTVGAGQTVSFANTETSGVEDLQIDGTDLSAAGTFQGAITGFRSGDVIDLVNRAGATGASIGADGTTLTVTFASGSAAVLKVSGLNSNTPVSLSALGTTGTRIGIALSESLADDTGSNATDEITRDPTLTGFGDPNATITFTEGTTVLGTASANASGAYTFTPTLADGTHTVVASESNAAGSVTASTTLTLVLDKTPPEVAITSPGGNVASATQTIAGTVSDAHPGGTVTLYDNGSSTALGTATVQSNGTWSTSVTLASGSNSLVAEDTDLAGNTGSSAAVSYTVGNTVSIGTGPDQLALLISEDAYQGDATYTVSVDGQQIGGVQTATAAHGTGDQTLLVNGSWGDGKHTFTVNFLNDLYGGSPSQDRNLYVDGASYNGTTVPGGNGSLYRNGPLMLAFNETPPQSTTTSVGSGPDQLVLMLSEDAYKGDAAYTVSVDGQQIGGVQTATQARGTGRNTLLVNGNWAPGDHSFAVNFVNDLYGGAADKDRNLYLEGATYNGTSVAGAQAALVQNGAQRFAFTDAKPPAETTTVGSGSDTLALNLSEDAYQGDAQYTVSIDGQQIGGTQTASAAHGSAVDQLLVKGNWAPGDHTFSINFLNDLYGGSPSTDRNLYLDSAKYNGATVGNAQTEFYKSGSQNFVFHSATSSA